MFQFFLYTDYNKLMKNITEYKNTFNILIYIMVNFFSPDTNWIIWSDIFYDKGICFKYTCNINLI